MDRISKMHFGISFFLLIFFQVCFSAGIMMAKPANIRLEADTHRPVINYLSWDTEGNDRLRNNLLRAPVRLRVLYDNKWIECSELSTTVHSGRNFETNYKILVDKKIFLIWQIIPKDGGFSFRFASEGHVASHLKLELIFPFNPKMTPTTLLPGEWNKDGSFPLPAIVSAPDFGQMVLSESSSPSRTDKHDIAEGHLEGSRAYGTSDFILKIAPLNNGIIEILNFKPLILSAPKNLKDQSLWSLTRRGWFNVYQPSAKWDDGLKVESGESSLNAPMGILSNNIISDPVSCLLGSFADHMLLYPELAPGISAAPSVAHTIEWWLDSRTNSEGEVAGYWQMRGFLDANAAPLIASWDYVEATSDHAWLKTQITKLELIAEYVAKRDIDGDGLVEAKNTGNKGALITPARSCSAYDAINCGYKDAYSNALIYRAWRCLADLEKQLGRNEQQTRYTKLADALKASYAKTLINPATGWLAWWKSEDGELHDYATFLINCLAIEYGLVDIKMGKEILFKLRAKLDAVGFNNFELGVPITLIPVPKADYLQGLKCCGVPEKEDGTDTFGKYLNGGCLVSDAIHFIVAHHIVGEGAKGDEMLKAMLKRQEKEVYPNGGSYQNGVVDKDMQGAEFYDWKGNTVGYEGFLGYSFFFTEGVLLREAPYRKRIYRVLMD